MTDRLIDKEKYRIDDDTGNFLIEGQELKTNNEKFKRIVELSYMIKYYEQLSTDQRKELARGSLDTVNVFFVGLISGLFMAGGVLLA